MRNLDMVALRAFVTVADSGGVTKASGLLHLTQSAVSMQLKRLEESVGMALLDRSTRTPTLTNAGEQMLSYARRILALNDEVLNRLTAKEMQGQITLGVPQDVVYPAIPQVLHEFAAQYPRMKVQLVSSYTSRLRRLFERGEVDLVLTTESYLDRGGETLVERPLVWVGAIDGQVWRQRPLRLASEEICSFRQPTHQALDRAGIAWEMAVEGDNTRSVEASTSADLAIYSCIRGAHPPYIAEIDHGGALPELPTIKINLYGAEVAGTEPLRALAEMLRKAYLAM